MPGINKSESVAPGKRKFTGQLLTAIRTSCAEKKGTDVEGQLK
jgi:hypothetical protein